MNNGMRFRALWTAASGTFKGPFTSRTETVGSLEHKVSDEAVPDDVSDPRQQLRGLNGSQTSWSLLTAWSLKSGRRNLGGWGGARSRPRGGNTSTRDEAEAVSAENSRWRRLLNDSQPQRKWEKCKKREELLLLRSVYGSHRMVKTVKMSEWEVRITTIESSHCPRPLGHASRSTAAFTIQPPLRRDKDQGDPSTTAPGAGGHC